MAAKNLNLTVDQGADYDQTLTFKDTSGAPINITGYTFAGQARTSVTAATACVTFGFVLAPQSGATLGQVLWTISAAQTAQLGAQQMQLVYDIVRTDSAGKKLRILTGSLAFNPGITR